jgi:hypothetical protein
MRPAKIEKDLLENAPHSIVMPRLCGSDSRVIRIANTLAGELFPSKSE